MNSKTILIIDDDSEIVNVVTEEGNKLGIVVIEFKPETSERNTLCLRLSELCTEYRFDFVLLDYELWHDLKGDMFTKTLNDNQIKFAAFTGSPVGNAILIKNGALFGVIKDYNSRGFRRDILIEGLEKMLEF